MAYSIRTDLALEAREMNQGLEQEPEGVSYSFEETLGMVIHNMEVINEAGAAALGKPVGKYCTIELEGITNRLSDSFDQVAAELAEQLKKLLPTISNIETVLVVGLGNRAITPDAVGTLAAEQVLVTRHLKTLAADEFKDFAPVCVTTPGVLGTTGIESGAQIKTLCEYLKPGCVIVVDALAAREAHRLCHTVQLSDSGITPGSGVGNSRAELSKGSVGVPVVAIGVPTVVDLSTILSDCGAADGFVSGEPLFVTSRNIDTEVRAAGKLIGYAINLALHEGLTVEDVDLLIG